MKAVSGHPGVSKVRHTAGAANTCAESTKKRRKNDHVILNKSLYPLAVYTRVRVGVHSSSRMHNMRARRHPVSCSRTPLFP
ncbi:rCG62569 [Rattus norvegicus]|uniref:RCG62569 n=1 Tax=Rattus norvegicus TaxID=10116 RepID=A6J683_RAT|nr:rCG62569 [Rattus norvegicus]